MTTQWETFPIKFEGGLITNRGRVEQGLDFPGSATTLQNFEADIKGGYTRINGYAKFSPNAMPNTGMIKGVVAVEANKVLAARNNRYYTSTGAGWTPVLVIPVSTASRIYSERYDFGSGEKFVVCDGVNMPAFYNVVAGTMAYGVGFPADVQGALFVKTFKNHLFYAVGKNLVFSAPYSDTDFTPANGAGIINIGDTITGLIVFREQLFIFCRNKISRLSGDTSTNFQLDPVTTNTGCLCGFTVQEVGGDVMYLSSDGVRYLSASERENDFGLTRASEKIQSEFIKINAATCVFSTVTLASKNQYRIFVYDETTPRERSKGFIAVKFSNQTADDIVWSTIAGMKVYSTSEYVAPDKELIFFSGEDDYVYQMETGSSFDDNDIDAIFETPYIPITDPKIRKTYYKHAIYTRSDSPNDLQLQLLFDYNVSGTLNPPPFVISTNSDSGTYGASGTTYGTAIYRTGSEAQFYNNVVGSSFVVALRYTNKSKQPSFNLNFAVLEFKTNDRR